MSSSVSTAADGLVTWNAPLMAVSCLWHCTSTPMPAELRNVTLEQSTRIRR